MTIYNAGEFIDPVTITDFIKSNHSGPLILIPDWMMERWSGYFPENSISYSDFLLEKIHNNSLWKGFRFNFDEEGDEECNIKYVSDLKDRHNNSEVKNERRKIIASAIEARIAIAEALLILQRDRENFQVDNESEDSSIFEGAYGSFYVGGEVEEIMLSLNAFYRDYYGNSQVKFAGERVNMIKREGSLIRAAIIIAADILEKNDKLFAEKALWGSIKILEKTRKKYGSVSIFSSELNPIKKDSDHINDNIDGNCHSSINEELSPSLINCFREKHNLAPISSFALPSFHNVDSSFTPTSFFIFVSDPLCSEVGVALQQLFSTFPYHEVQLIIWSYDQLITKALVTMCGNSHYKKVRTSNDSGIWDIIVQSFIKSSALLLPTINWFTILQGSNKKQKKIVNLRVNAVDKPFYKDFVDLYSKFIISGKICELDQNINLPAINFLPEMESIAEYFVVISEVEICIGWKKIIVVLDDEVKRELRSYLYGLSRPFLLSLMIWLGEYIAFLLDFNNTNKLISLLEYGDEQIKNNLLFNKSLLVLLRKIYPYTGYNFHLLQLIIKITNHPESFNIEDYFVFFGDTSDSVSVKNFISIVLSIKEEVIMQKRDLVSLWQLQLLFAYRIMSCGFINFHDLAREFKTWEILSVLDIPVSGQEHYLFLVQLICESVEDDIGCFYYSSVDNENIGEKSGEVSKVNVGRDSAFEVMTIEDFLSKSEDEEKNIAIFYCNLGKNSRRTSLQQKNLYLIWLLLNKKITSRIKNEFYLHEGDDSKLIQYFLQNLKNIFKFQQNTSIISEKKASAFLIENSKKNKKNSSVSPPLSMRPKYLSYTSLTKLLANPYLYYVENILSIRPLDIFLDENDIQYNRDFGLALHFALAESNHALMERFRNSDEMLAVNFDDGYGLQIYLDLLLNNFLVGLRNNVGLSLASYLYSIWKGRVKKSGKWLWENEKKAFASFFNRESHVEAKFEWIINIYRADSSGKIISFPFKVQARADRVDYCQRKDCVSDLKVAQQDIMGKVEKKSIVVMNLQRNLPSDEIGELCMDKMARQTIFITEYKTGKAKKSDVSEQLAMVVLVMFKGDLELIKRTDIILRWVEINGREVNRGEVILNPPYSSVLDKIMLVLQNYYGNVSPNNSSFSGVNVGEEIWRGGQSNVCDIALVASLHSDVVKDIDKFDAAGVDTLASESFSDVCEMFNFSNNFFRFGLQSYFDTGVVDLWRKEYRRLLWKI